LNKFWTFEKKEEKVKAGEFFKFLIVTTIGLLINVSVAVIVVNLIGFGAKVRAGIIAPIIAAFFAFVWNFLASKFIVFKK
jgi:putative flippase GtrA